MMYIYIHIQCVYIYIQCVYIYIYIRTLCVYIIYIVCVYYIYVGFYMMSTSPLPRRGHERSKRSICGGLVDVVKW